VYGIIDIGSNTIRLSVYNTENNNIKPIFHKKYVAGLAGYIDEADNLSQKGIQKAADVLNGFKIILNTIEVNEVFVFATASLRNIKNTESAVKTIEEQSGFNIQVLSGEEEATYDYFGATLKNPMTDGILVDIGGGSTELVFFRNGQIDRALSMAIGSLNLCSKYVSNLMPDKNEIKNIKKVVVDELKKIQATELSSDVRIICGIGGTVRATCKLSNDIFGLPSSNRQLNVENVKKILHLFNKNRKEFLLKILQIAPDRLHTIIPGMVVLRSIAKFYNCEVITVSQYGVREGYLYQMLNKGE
jgi:exopolyphosphatase/guanosine-5'-triphosphate,3'-diphosphate pyrophosphatase